MRVWMSTNGREFHSVGTVAGHQELVVLLAVVGAGRHARPLDLIVGEGGLHLFADELKALLYNVRIVVLRQHVELELHRRALGRGFFRVGLRRGLLGRGGRGGRVRRLAGVGRGGVRTARERGDEHRQGQEQRSQLGLLHTHISFSLRLFSAAGAPCVPPHSPRAGSSSIFHDNMDKKREQCAKL